jgi:hypothetical protein
MKLTAAVLLACLLLPGALPVFSKGAIDLVALKKQEEERRKKIAKSKQSVNDTNVSAIIVPGKSYGFVQMESDVPPEASVTGEPAAAPVAVAGDMPVEKTPDFWKKQQADLEARIAELKAGINAQQSELNKLWSDFYTRTVAAEQTAIKVQISNITSQIEQKKLFLSQSETQLEDLYERARKAGVPPGWLR